MVSETRKYEILTGLTILVLTFGLLLAGELALRAIQWLKFGQYNSVETSSAYFIDEETGLRLNVPDRQLGQIRINNLGFRGPDMSYEKHRDTFRLAFLGNSITYDVYSPEGGNWPELVAKNLEENLEGCKVDFVNAGKPNYDSDDMAKLFQNFVIDTNPDFVLVTASEITSSLKRQAKQQGFGTDHTTYQSALNRYSLLLQKLEKNFRIIQLQRAADSLEGKFRVDQQALVKHLDDKLDKLLGAIASDTRLVGVITLGSIMSEEMTWKELVVTGNTRLYYMPYIYLPDLIGLPSAYNESIPEVTVRHNAISIGGEREIPNNSKYYKNWDHFTPEGSEAMSSRVLKQLLSSPEFIAVLAERGCHLI